MGGGTEVIELCGGPCNSHESRKLTFVSKTGHLLDALTSPHVRTDVHTFTAHNAPTASGRHLVMSISRYNTQQPHINYLRLRANHACAPPQCALHTWGIFNF